MAARKETTALEPVAPTTPKPKPMAVQARTVGGPIDAWTQPQTLEEALRLSELAARSAMVPATFRGKPADVMVAAATGAQMGLSFFQALRSVYVIDGNPGVKTEAMVAAVLARPDVCEWIDEKWNERSQTWTATTKRVGNPNVQKRSYSWKEAEENRLTVSRSGKRMSNWDNHAKRMLRARATGYLMQDVYPDVICGVRPIEMLEDDVRMRREESVSVDYEPAMPAESGPVVPMPEATDGQEEEGRTRAVASESSEPTPEPTPDPTPAPDPVPGAKSAPEVEDAETVVDVRVIDVRRRKRSDGQVVFAILAVPPEAESSKLQTTYLTQTERLAKDAKARIGLRSALSFAATSLGLECLSVEDAR